MIIRSQIVKRPFKTSIQFTSTQLSQYLNSRVRVAESNNVFWRTHINKKDQGIILASQHDNKSTPWIFN